LRSLYIIREPTKLTVEKKHPRWLLPNLLSLDAPIVAMIWAWMFAQTWRVRGLDDNIYFLLGGAVWIIYVVDRYIDNKVSGDARRKTSARHDFHAHYWKWFKLGIFLVGGFVFAIGFQLPKGVFLQGSIILLFVSLYIFLAVFSESNKGPQNLKNVVAGFTFSYGVALGVYYFRPSESWFQLYSPLVNKEVFLFGLLCACNITAIDIWEASRASDRIEEKTQYEFLLTIPRSRFSLNALRAMADAALIVPLPIFYLYSLTI